MKKLKFAGIVFLISISIMILSVLGSVIDLGVKAEPVYKSPTNGLTPHEPIYIEGNENFTSENGVSSGSGTSSDPYIIEGWNISAWGISAQHFFDCIRIKNTSRYFVIRNCVVYGGGMINNGIYFYNVSHGTINNVISYDNNKGIWLDFSSNNKITNCTLHKNYDEGICLGASSYIIITNCIVCDTWDYGVGIAGSSNVQIAHSTIYNNSHTHQWYAVHIYNSSVEIRYCNIYNNPGYGVYNSKLKTKYVDATYCWWGSPDGPSGEGPGSGDKVSEKVLYEPWLTKPWQEGIEISKPTEKPPEGFNMFYLLGIGVAVAAGIIIGVFILRRRAAISKPEIPPKPELIPPQIPTLTLRCPQCKSTFTVEKKEKPFKVKCPSCGKEGVIR